MKPDMEQQAQAAWLQSRIDQWRRFETMLQADRRRPGDNIDDARELLDGYRSLTSDLSLARRILPGGRIIRYLESLFSRGHEIIYAAPGGLFRNWLALYRSEVPGLMRSMAMPLISTIALFIGSIIAGWLLIAAYPELISLFASAEMVDKVQQKELWTDGLLNVMPSSILSISIIANNITVTLFAFALGALYGVGTLYIIGLNGFMLGGIFAFTAQYQMDGRLFEFIVAHGVVELSIICIAGAMGLRLGEALIRPGPRNRVQAFQQTVNESGKIILTATPFLILVGLIEGYISPNADFGLGFRVAVGVTSGVLFWGLMLFGTQSLRKRVGPRALHHGS